MECREIDLEHEGESITLLIIPVAAPDTQFLLCNDINEIRSVGYAMLMEGHDEGGQIKWKWGTPYSLAEPEKRRALEKKILEALK